MPIHMESVYKELNHTFLMSDTLQTYTSLWINCIEMVSWFGNQLV